MTKHLLTCECGKELSVEVSQAGQQIVCSCGRSIQLPRMREIRELPRVAGEAATVTSAAAKTWTSAHGAVFAFGVLLLTVGLFLVFYAYVNLQRVAATVPPPDAFDGWVSEVKQAPFDEVWNAWTELREGIPAGLPPIAITRRTLLGLGRLRLIGASLAAIGGLSVAGSLLLGRRAKSARRARR